MQYGWIISRYTASASFNCNAVSFLGKIWCKGMLKLIFLYFSRRKYVWWRDATDTEFWKIHTLSLAGTSIESRYFEFWKCVFTLTHTFLSVRTLDSLIVVWTSNSEDFITSTFKFFPLPLIIPSMETLYMNHILLPQILATTSSPMFSNRTSVIFGLMSSAIDTLCVFSTFLILAWTLPWIRAISTSWAYRSNWC